MEVNNDKFGDCKELAAGVDVEGFEILTLTHSMP